MDSRGVILGKQATEQLAKVVREHSRRVVNETPQRPRWHGRPGSGGVQVIRFELTAEVVVNSQFTALVKSRPIGTRTVSEETEYGTVTVHDMIGCLLDEDEADLIGRQGYATYLETRDEYDTPTKRWEITSLCCP